MKKGQKSVRGGIQDFLCPFTDMYITQGSNSRPSHMGIMANDVRGKVSGVKYPYYAPCDVKLIWRDLSTGEGMWQSLTKVRFANGRIDYATFVTVHDNTFDAKVGQIVRQGEQLGNMGTKGNATGVHCHIEIAQHKYTIKDWHKNKYGVWCFPSETDTDGCYFVDNTNIMNYKTANWKTIPKPTPVKHKIGYQAHVQKQGWQGWKYDGETSGTTGKGLRMEAIKIDYNKEVYAKAHIQGIGWKDFGKITKDTVIGTTGKGYRLEALCLKGDFKYRVHIQNVGWTTWTNADGVITLGSVGQGLCLEAIQIK